MTTNETTNDGEVMVAADARKPHTGGVPSNESASWYIAEVKYNHERLCRERVKDLGFDSYVASQSEMHYYDKSHKREVEHIVIPRRVFIRMADKDRVPLMRDCSYIYHFMTDRAKMARNSGQKAYAMVPDSQMRDLQYMLYHASNPVSFTDQPLRLGERVRVVRGPLKGLAGQFLREAATTHIVITIEGLGCAMTSVEKDDVERIE